MCKVSDGISHLNPFFCQECGYELPEYLMSKVQDVCMDCEKEIRHPLHQDTHDSHSIDLEASKPRLTSPLSSMDSLHAFMSLAQSSEPFPF